MKELIPMKQTLEASCVPTATSMVLSGFGIDQSEHELIATYFPSAALSPEDPHAGVTVPNIARGLVNILRNQQLEEPLSVDVFIPSLWRFTRSSADRWIVPASPRAARRFVERYTDFPDTQEIYLGLAQLAEQHQIGLYTGNNRQLRKMLASPEPEPIRDQFYKEFQAWIQQGHAIGSHGGLTCHVWAVDGVRTNDQGYWLNDPRGESYRTNTNQSLMRVDPDFGVISNNFDYLFRVAPQVATPPRGFDAQRTWQELKNRLRR